MWSILIVLVLTTTTSSLNQQRILGGRPVALGEFPMQAVFVKNNPWQLLCGGSIISKRTILTAAHCFVGCNRNCLKGYRAVVGDVTLHESNSPPSTRKVYKLRQLALHERFSLKYIKNDIAIVQIVGHFDVSKNVGIATLAKTQPSVGTSCTVCGYGVTGDAIFSEQLLATEVSVLNADVCRKRLPGFDADTMVCGGSSTDINNPCNGDSGGPLLCGADKIQAGIVSFGPNCSGGVSYTDVAAFADWITEHEAAMLARKITAHSAHKSKASKFHEQILLIIVLFWWT